MSIGLTELIVIVIVALVIFGGRKGNDAAKMVGGWIRSAKSSLKTVKEEMSEASQPFDEIKKDATDIVTEFKKEV